MESLDQAVCQDDPAITPNPPDALFDTLSVRPQVAARPAVTRGELARQLLLDGGEVGGCVRDTFLIEVTDAGGNLIFVVPETDVD